LLPGLVSSINELLISDNISPRGAIKAYRTIKEAEFQAAEANETMEGGVASLYVRVAQFIWLTTSLPKTLPLSN
jgi:hypothetical protein